MKTLNNVRTVDVVDQPGRMPFGVGRGGHLVRDVLLTPPTPREFAVWAASMARTANLGVVWDGLEATFEAFDKHREMVFKRFDAYRTIKAGAKSGTDTHPDQRGFDTHPGEPGFMGRTAKDSANMAADMNARNKAFWDKRLGR